MTKPVRTALLFASCITLLAGCREPVVTQPPPDTFLVTEVSGTLTPWSAGEAFVTLSAGYAVTSGSDPATDRLELAPPLYQSSVSADGTFRTELSVPLESSFMPLGCTGAEPDIARLSSVVAATVAAPTTEAETIGFYNLGDPQGSGKRGLWLYIKGAYKAKTSCASSATSGLSAIDLTLAPGWNQVLASFTENGVVLTSGAIPDAFIWAEYF